MRFGSSHTTNKKGFTDYMSQEHIRGPADSGERVLQMLQQNKAEQHFGSFNVRICDVSQIHDVSQIRDAIQSP